MAAAKEAVVIVLDVGASMCEGSTTRLEGAVKAVHMLVQQKLLFSPKDEIGLVLYGTRATKNNLQDQGYANVNVIRDITVPDIGLLAAIDNIAPEKQHADFLDALIVGMDMLINKKGKYDKRIFLVTDGGQEANTDGIEMVLDQFKRMSAKLNIIGIDFTDHDEDNEPEEPEVKAEQTVKARSEALLRRIAKEVGGVVVGVHQALQLMSYFRSRSVLQRSSFRGNLEISPLVKIPIFMFVRASEQKFPTMKKLSIVSEQSAAPNSMDVKMQRSYHSLADLDTDVVEEERVKGFKYGKSLVPISAQDEQNTKYETERELVAIGFAKASSVPCYHYMSNSQVCVPAPGQLEASRALSALVHALAETDSVLIVRFVKIKNAAPHLGVLLPHIKNELEYLIYQKLPFAEDLRHYPFAPLDPGQIRAAYAPSQTQLDAAERLIESLDLMTASKDEDGEPMESLKPKFTYNPVLQRFYQCVQHRALHPDAPLPPLDPIIGQYCNPDQQLFTGAKRRLDDFKRLFPLSLATPAVGTKRTYWSDIADTEVKLDSYVADGKKRKTTTDEDFSMDTIVAGGTNEVGSVQPVKDFRDMLSRRDMDLVEKAIQEMEKRILQLVNDSIRDQFYSKALECLVALRQGCVQEEEADAFNKFLRSLRNVFERKRRNDFWELVASTNITLVHEGECDASSVSQQESEEFLRAPQAPPAEAQAATGADEDEADDLFDMIE